MKPIKELIVIKEGRDDINYTLVRTESGETWVETFYSPNQTFARGHSGAKLLPEDFDTEDIDGKPLRFYVEKALQRIDGSASGTSSDGMSEQ